MAKATEDLWPEIDGAVESTPVGILRQQASLLGPKTQNVVGAEVSTASVGVYIQHRFLLVAPALDNYRYHLLTVSHAAADLYPVTFDALDDEVEREVRTEAGGEALQAGKITAGSEEEFLSILRKILSSERTQRVINALLSQSQAVGK
jgi:hypothetical protein